MLFDSVALKANEEVLVNALKANEEAVVNALKATEEAVVNALKANQEALVNAIKEEFATNKSHARTQPLSSDSDASTSI